jgi:hypothetical protein
VAFPERTPNCFAVPLSVESSATVVPNEADVDTCSRYRIAPVTAFHVTTGDVGMFVELFSGDASVGAAGGSAIVVNAHTADQSL